MKVKDLIKELERHDPEDRVKVEIQFMRNGYLVSEIGKAQKVEVDNGERERVVIQATA